MIRMKFRLFIDIFLCRFQIQKTFRKLHIGFLVDYKMLASEEITKKLEENMEKIKQYGVKRIGLFGSYVKNEQKKESDIDILVEFEEGKKTFDNYMDLKFFLEDLFQCKVDLVIKESIKPDLRKYILDSVKYARV